MASAGVSLDGASETEANFEIVADGDVTTPDGFRAAGVCCGLKRDNRDLALLVSDQPASVAGVFTQNKVKAAPVLYSQRVVAKGSARAVICNSSNANACTGEVGNRDAQEMAALTADELGLLSSQVLVASTGVIGEPLEMTAIRSGIPAVVDALARSGREAAEAIQTTDTFSKTVAARISLSGGVVSLGGMAKGAGMIQPNMATALAFLTTDAGIPAGLLQTCLAESIEASFNRVTVDGDTSTNDCAFLFSNGASGVELEEGSEELTLFQHVLTELCVELAKMLVRDGEGATKLIEVIVEGALNDDEARRAAFTIANSPLVKTALYGCQVNWGRVLAAAGRADVEMSESRSEIWFNSRLVASGGIAVEQDLSEITKEMAAPEVGVRIALGVGEGRATVWTCDLTEDYIRINGSYIS